MHARLNQAAIRAEASPTVLSTYQNYLFYTSNPGQTLQRTSAEPTVARAQKYYAANIGKVKTVDDFLNNFQLFSYAMNAYGLQDFGYGKAFMRQVLTSDLSDQHSFVNKLTDSRYRAFAQAFGFDTKGKLTNNASVQTTDQASDTLKQFATAIAAANSTAVSSESSYMKTALGSITSVSDLTGNKRLFSDLLTTYGLNPATSVQSVTDILESDKSDPDSAYNQTNVAGLKALAADFNVDSTGAVTSPQTTDQAADTLKLYTAKATSAKASAASAESTYLQTALASVKSVSDLTGDSRLLSDVLTAYGVDASTSAASVTNALESDPSDPHGAVSLSGSPGLKKLVADFNFDATGAAATQRVVQTQASLKAMSVAYGTAAGTDAYAKSQAGAETLYVATAIGKATSIDDLVNDPRIVGYIGKAFGEPKLTAATLRSVLTSDLSDPKSKANTLGTDYARMAAAFEFTPKGTVAREASQAAQTRSALAATNSAYVEQTIETEAGDDSAGTKLALYFARKAPTLANVYEILADPALLKFSQTLLGLPTTSSSQSIDSQAALLQKKLKLTDLKDPAKVKTIVARFSALYDLANPSSDQTSILTLFSSSNNSSSS